MDAIGEIESLIRRSRALLALEVDHLHRVLAAGLDPADAQWTIERRCHKVEQLEMLHQAQQSNADDEITDLDPGDRG